ncbi:MAG TPA: hypothetical protein VHK63_06160 [Candidatus Limnocylindria bacterium]|nr:hypothetical protein [Candidatus Limnocylindria bacterium]
MSQVNVNTPGGEPAPVRDGSGYGLIVGILIAILVIALVLWLLVFNQPAAPTDTDGTTTEESEELPASSGWRLIDSA